MLLLREDTNCIFFSGPATMRGGSKGRATKKKDFFKPEKSKKNGATKLEALVAGPLKKKLFWLPLLGKFVWANYET